MNSKDNIRLEWSEVLRAARTPIHERVLDRLADLLFETDEMLEMLGGEDASGVRWIESDMQRVYEIIDALMRKMAD